MNIIVEPYNEQWPIHFEIEARKISDGLGDNLVQLHHIGSTAVPGLSAKPVIDILLIVSSLEVLDQNDHHFGVLGYEVMGEFGMEGRRYYRKGGDDRTHQIHAFEVRSIYDIERHLIFRDYLRAHSTDRLAYGDLKERIALEYPFDIDGYGDAKDALVKELERKALLWYYKNKR
ncbi:GrpB family protein [Erysipelothrix anatis]|uniref:GrpB family protein n=1 Tax=Erysipelothrix anatis TaxID=2683713 RepID=UPI0013582F89|nr:GrpB family protein [Erysipelothrix anatis]